MHRDAIIAELRTTLPILAIAIAVLVFGAWKVLTAANDSTTYQREIRVAQVERARVLSLQLDEETGLRGYTGTGDPFLLEPYDEARPRMASAFARLERDLAALRIDRTRSIAADEKRANTRWMATIAGPLRADWHYSPRSLELLRRGEQIIDGFRNDDHLLWTRLEDASARADLKTRLALRNLLFYIVAALILMTIGSIGLVLTRAARGNQRRLADALQKALLNQQLPRVPNVVFHAVYVPATHNTLVGGDWYDAYELPDKRILFSIGDVAGHGLQAAVVMSRARQAIIAAALHEDDPAKVLERANNAILLQESCMVTAICGYIDPATFEVVYATAGHPPPVLAAPGRPPIFLLCDGIPLGVFADTTYRSFRATVSSGALMLLYTDGVIEYDRDIIAGQDRLLEATRLAAEQNDPARAVQRYIFSSATPIDDIAIMSVMFKKEHAWLPAASNNGLAAATSAHSA